MAVFKRARQLLDKGVSPGIVAIAAAMAFASPAAGQADEAVTYTIAPGDTLIGLSGKYFTDGKAVRAVADYNEIRNPRRIPVGTELRIPRDLLAFDNVRVAVLSFSGPVTISGRPPSVGTALAEGAVVRTGARGFISFQSADGATFSMPSNSVMRLERARIYRLGGLRDVEFRVLDGRGNVRAPKLKTQERYRVGTPVAVTAVRGTEFRVAHSEEDGSSATEVVEGVVGVAAGAIEQRTGAGFGIAASKSGLGTQERLLPPIVITEPGAIQTGELVEFAITPPAGSRGSRTQLALDAGFLEVVAEQVVEGESVAFENLENGRYYVRSRAIAASGIEGLSDTFTFRRKRLGAEAAAEPSALDDALKFAWRAEGDGTVHYAFQLWDKARPDVLLIDELAPADTAQLVASLKPGTYVWRVAAMQVDEGEWLKVWGPSQELNITE